jgi:8-oxo-dGTP pyrophosphatase MutT (NUDIX family)
LVEWVVHGERRLYENRWVSLDQVEVELPDGDRFWHHVVRMQRIGAVLVLDEDASQVLLLRRHRFIAGTWGWEVPTGIVEPDEDGAAAASREVEEETGHRVENLQLLFTYQPCIGIADTPHELFVARGAKRVGPPTDINEASEVAWFDGAGVERLLSTGEVHDGTTLLALVEFVRRRQAQHYDASASPGP